MKGEKRYVGSALRNMERTRILVVSQNHESKLNKVKQWN